MKAKFQSKRNAFTLVELLVVIAIIGILVALLLPAIQAAREAARRSQCLSQIKQVALACQNYMSAKKRFPLGAKNSVKDYSGLTYGSNRQTWFVDTLPYLEEQAIYDRYDQNYKGVSNTNWFGTGNPNSLGANAPASQVITSMLCPSDGEGATVVYTARGNLALGNYLGFFGDRAHDHGIEPEVALSKSPASKRHAFGINFGASSKDFVDGSSKTLLFGEYLRGLPGYTQDYRGAMYQDEATNSQLQTAYTPNNSTPDRIYVGYCVSRPELNLPCVEDHNELGTSRSQHPGGVMVALCDGSARFVTDDIDDGTWKALGTLKENDIPGEY